MTEFTVTRAHLKNTVDQKNWDLLDKLLEIDNSRINDNSLYTDTWGEWWGMLNQCVFKGHEKGVRVLLKHGADCELATWGDGMLTKPIEAAKDKPSILKLLQSSDIPTYERKSEPPLPQTESAKDKAVNRQGDVRDTVNGHSPPF